jgi:hypothetical protein
MNGELGGIEEEAQCVIAEIKHRQCIVNLEEQRKEAVKCSFKVIF